MQFLQDTILLEYYGTLARWAELEREAGKQGQTRRGRRWSDWIAVRIIDTDQGSTMPVVQDNGEAGVEADEMRLNQNDPEGAQSSASLSDFDDTS